MSAPSTCPECATAIPEGGRSCSAPRGCSSSFGLLAFATMFCTSGLIETMPLTLAFIAAPALWGFWTSRGKRALFGDDLLEQAERQRA